MVSFLMKVLGLKTQLKKAADEMPAEQLEAHGKMMLRVRTLLLRQLLASTSTPDIDHVCRQLCVLK